MRSSSHRNSARDRRRVKSGHLGARGTERSYYPFRVREPARGDRLDLSFNIVFDPADRWRDVINQHIRSAGIAVKGLANTACVDHRQTGHVPHERLVNVAVDGDRLAKRQIRRFEFRIRSVRLRRAPRAAGLACTNASGG